MKSKLGAVLLVSAMAMAACSGNGADETDTTSPTETAATDTQTDDPSPDGTTTGEPATSVATGTGVTDDTITLGMLPDLTGVFGGQGRTLVAADEMYWNNVNDEGGVCGRQVEVVVRDHGYDPQRAVAAYQELQPDILALHQVLGSPVQAALLPLTTEDEVAMGQVGWSSEFTGNPYAVITGTSYDIQMLIGLQYLVNEGLIAEGDTIGHVYFEGDFGGNSLRGSQFAADQLGLELMEARITPQVQDLTTQVTQFQNAGATAILLSAASPQLAGVVNAQRALSYNVPIMGQIPNFVPSLLDDPAVAEHLGEYYYMSTPIAPLGAEIAEVQEIADQFTQENPDVSADINVVFSFAHAMMFEQALRTACEQGDLTRAAFVETLTSLENVETGISTPVTYVTGQPSGTEVYIARTSPDVVGGLQIAEDGVTSPLVDQYELPGGE